MFNSSKLPWLLKSSWLVSAISAKVAKYNHGAGHHRSLKWEIGFENRGLQDEDGTLSWKYWSRTSRNQAHSNQRNGVLEVGLKLDFNEFFVFPHFAGFQRGLFIWMLCCFGYSWSFSVRCVWIWGYEALSTSSRGSYSWLLVTLINVPFIIPVKL